MSGVPLAPHTTLGLGGPARQLVEARSRAELVAAVEEADLRRAPLLILGGGSNLVVSDEGFAGTVVKIGTRGVTVDETDEARVVVTAEAGEPWDDVVALAVSRGWSGVECLSGIPGQVGAVPMQNVGAYGQDVGETIRAVHTWDRDARRLVVFDRDDCRFAYRSSVFRGRDRHVILAVTFAFERRAESQPLRYAELTGALGIATSARAPLAQVRDTVIALRRKKGMVVDAADPDTASAGSFFTNPIVDAAELERVRQRVAPRLREGERMPSFAEPDGRTKLSAAWLIERAGFTKGHAVGRAAISHKHALALTNRGGATTEELLALARRIRDGVEDAFGVRLENEPVFVGVRL